MARVVGPESIPPTVGGRLADKQRSQEGALLNRKHHWAYFSCKNQTAPKHDRHLQGTQNQTSVMKPSVSMDQGRIITTCVKAGLCAPVCLALWEMGGENDLTLCLLVCSFSFALY